MVISPLAEKLQKPQSSFRDTRQQLHVHIKTMYCSLYVGSALQTVFPHWFVVKI